jgi:hypothetical protein
MISIFLYHRYLFNYRLEDKTDGVSQTNGGTKTLCLWQRRGEDHGPTSNVQRQLPKHLMNPLIILLTEHQVDIFYHFSCQFLWVTLTARNP